MTTTPGELTVGTTAPALTQQSPPVEDTLADISHTLKRMACILEGIRDTLIELEGR
jgi:hypothetical protein